MLKLKSKIVIIFFIFILTIFYSAPNFYSEHPSIIIRSEKNIDDIFVLKISKFLKQKNIKIKNIYFNKNNKKLLILKFYSTESQFLAYDLLNAKDFPVNLSLKLISNSFEIFEKFNAFPIKLGLDLRGGVHLLLKVNIKSIIKKINQFNVNIIIFYLKNNNINYTLKTSKSHKIIEIKFLDKIDIINIKHFLKMNVFDFSIIECSENSIKLKLLFIKKIEVINHSIEKIIGILSKRISELNISDFVINKSGLNRIVVEIPGIQDISYAKQILGKTATLKFMLVDNGEDFYKKKNISKIFYDDKDMPFLLKSDIVLTGEDIIRANFNVDSFLNEPCVDVILSKSAGKMFNKITSKNIGNFMAIVYQDFILENNQEFIKESIINIAKIMTSLNDKFQITGLTMHEAKELAILLRSGSLPTSLIIIEEKVIGPVLGEKNVIQGITIILISFVVIFLFMIFRYKLFGFLASISLILNIFLLIAFISFFSITLTLAGLAGIALIIGISIDANILIFERIKEEKNNIELGFKNAYRSIFDSNVTTFLMGGILYIFAIGPIKIFALTLCFGVLSSFYSSVFVTKTLIDLIKEGI